MSTVKELVEKNRSYRRFDASKKITKEQLEAFINLARLSSSGVNRQYLKYVICYTKEATDAVFPNLRWAGALKDWDGPIVEERPTAYIIMLRDKQIFSNMFVDEGIAAQSILLGAVDAGFGGCMLMNIDRMGIMKALKLDAERYDISMVIALGVPVETVVIEPMPADGNFNYWRDEQQVHHVPKRSLAELILDEK
ncbi:MAG: nitroreductase family protein [Lachnospiraceae bacterium]